jgi:hypothetical protein
MIRKLKTVGLALIAIFAFSAIAASAAFAQQGELTSDGPVTLTVTETGGAGANKLVAFGNTTECPGSTYTGHKVLTAHETSTGIKHGFLSPGATTATITPHYKQKTAEGKFNCKAAGLPMTITTNGCDLVYHIGSQVGGDSTTFKLTTDVVCPVGKKIEYEAYTGEGEGVLACRFTLGSVDGAGNPVNQGLSGPHLKHTNTGGADDIDISGVITGLHMERHAGLCGGASTTNVAELFVDLTVTGHSQVLGSTPVTVSP